MSRYGLIMPKKMGKARTLPKQSAEVAALFSDDPEEDSTSVASTKSHVFLMCVIQLLDSRGQVNLALQAEARKAQLKRKVDTRTMLACRAMRHS